MSEQDLTFRKDLSLPGMLGKINTILAGVPDPLQTSRPRIPLQDCLKAALAMFLLKYPSLLSFDDAQEEEIISNNLKKLFSLEKIPSDTYMRERLDVIDPFSLRPIYKAIFSLLQRGNELKEYWYGEGYLLSMDGTGLFSSHEVHCDQCNVKKHKNGSKTYYHQMLSAVLVHPDKKEVIPLAPEPILKTDGKKKNDCERNAAKRLLEDIHREHPHLQLIVVEDGLASNGPHISLLKHLNMRFILGAKPEDHKFLFDWVSRSKYKEYAETDKNGMKHHYKFINNAPLNETCFDLSVNFLEYWEESNEGKTQHFSWVTDIPLTISNVKKITRGGRARWKIENETFNTLKNQGYHFEHNFGHGNKNLCTVFAYLMMLAFLIDQVQQLCCRVFQEALKFRKRKRILWERMRQFFASFLFKNWEDFFRVLREGLPKFEISFNSS